MASTCSSRLKKGLDGMTTLESAKYTALLLPRSDRRHLYRRDGSRAVRIRRWSTPCEVDVGILSRRRSRASMSSTSARPPHTGHGQRTGCRKLHFSRDTARSGRSYIAALICDIHWFVRRQRSFRKRRLLLNLLRLQRFSRLPPDDRSRRDHKPDHEALSCRPAVSITLREGKEQAA